MKRPELFDAALADHRAGRLDAAKEKYAALLRDDPKQPDASHLLAQITFTQGDPEGALALVRQAIAHNRKDGRYHVTLALMLNRLDRASEAEAAARRAIALDQRDAGAYVNLGIALKAQGALAEAARALGRAVQLIPTDAVALANLGAVHLDSGQSGLALDFLRRAVAANPGNAIAWANLAEAAHHLDRTDESLAAAERAVALDPGHAPGHAALGALRLEAGAPRAAVACYERALALRPHESKYLGKLGNALLAADRPEDALAAYDRLLAAMPGDPGAIYNGALCHLLLGNLDAGLEAYEARWGVPSAGFTPRSFDRPRWTVEDSADVRLFIACEQGLGDQLFNAGFLPALGKLGVRCTYECDSRLVGLIARSFPDVTVLATGAAVPEHDYWIPAGSLLRELRHRLGSVPVVQGWLRPDAARVAEYRRRLADMAPGPWIGISWRSARKRVGPHKSMPLAAWEPVLQTAAARFVNLQYGETDAEIAAAAAATGVSIHSDPDLDRFADLEGLAALIAALDLVITTSNVTAHIAGALGRDAWVALQKVPLWYWELTGEESRYYPTLRLFRQDEVGAWSGVAARIAAELRQYLGG